MANTAKQSATLAYPDRFYPAASYLGLDGSAPSSVKQLSSKFSNDTALLLYALHQQATVGPCNTPKPSAWNPAEQSKWKSWQGLGTMPFIEAKRHFVKILEEGDSSWYPNPPNSVPDPAIDVQISTMTTATEDGRLMETQDKDVVLENPNTISVYNQWTAPLTSGHPPKARYEHGAAVIQDKMYMYGGNHNGRYLGDLHVLDLKNWTWSRVETKVVTESQETSSPATLTHCAGHSLIPWDNKLLSIGGHAKDPSESILDFTWRPVSDSCGKKLVIFGGQNVNKSLLNDLHLLDLDTMTWDEIDAVSDHAAAVHAERYLLIFGGGSHTNCFSDLHVLDLQTMEWSRHAQQGEAPTPRAGHAGVTIGENWFIVGGGDNKSGACETVVLNMSTLAWSVLTTVQGGAPLASEGLSLVVSSYNGEDVIVAFGGYNGRYNNEVNVLKPSHKSSLKSKIMEASPVRDSVSAVNNATTRDIESEIGVSQESKVREIVMDNVNSGSKVEGKSERIITSLRSEKEELEASLSKEKIQTLQLKEELTETETRSTELYKELHSVRSQLAAEQSRCFKLEVEVAEVRQKLQTMETLEKELELLHRQRAVASEQAAVNMNGKPQSSGGVWGWLAGTPPPKT
ncbi:hypothetical protein Bca52824_055263 [Brassica carinata]|uniref:ACB domain-containing protein n=1 Tax=Brassica carinata TaxID=52824 RepID=A0A8X7RC21_BRACI|nr:hypothetical protein Bca52824_055263 [Brassica carinata]